MDNKLSKTAKYIFDLVMIASVVMLVVACFALRRISWEKHYTIQNSAYLLGVLGVVMTAVVFYIRMLCRKDAGLRYLIVCNFMIATWIYMRSDAMSGIEENLFPVGFVKISMITLVIVPAVLFLDEFQQYRYHKTTMSFVMLAVIDWVGCTVFYVFFDSISDDVYMGCQIIVIMILCICIYQLLADVIRHRSDVARQVLIAILFTLAGTIVEIFYIWNKKYEWLDILFGFLIFISILGMFQSVSYATVVNFLQEQRRKNQKITDVILSKLTNEASGCLQGIRSQNKYILEHCMEEELFIRASELEMHSWKLSLLIRNIEDYISTITGEEPRRIEKVDMKEVLNHIMHGIADEAERRDTELNILVEEGFPSVILADFRCIEGMLFGLLLHAITTSDNGKKVTFQTGYLAIGEDTIKLIATVESSNIGMEKSELKKLKHMFKHLQDIDTYEMEGIALGLQSVMVLAKHCGCTIAIESEIGKGDRIELATICKVADRTPIGEFADWYIIQETYYQKYRKRILKQNQENSLKKKLQEKSDEIRSGADKVENKTETAVKRILLAGDIHVDSALRYVGEDYQQYVQIMRLFPKKKQEKQKLLQQYYEEKDYLNYTIQVHALKNNARMLGADKLADIAFSHEKAGNRKDGEYLNEHYEELLAEWDRVNDVFNEYLSLEKEEYEEDDAEQVREKMTGEEWKSYLHQITEYLELFQKKEALELLGKMKEYRMTREQTEVIQAAIEAVQRYDYDVALEILNAK